MSYLRIFCVWLIVWVYTHIHSDPNIHIPSLTSATIYSYEHTPPQILILTHHLTQLYTAIHHTSHNHISSHAITYKHPLTQPLATSFHTTHNHTSSHKHTQASSHTTHILTQLHQTPNTSHHTQPHTIPHNSLTRNPPIFSPQVSSQLECAALCLTVLCACYNLEVRNSTLTCTTLSTIREFTEQPFTRSFFSRKG